MSGPVEFTHGEPARPAPPPGGPPSRYSLRVRLGAAALVFAALAVWSATRSTGRHRSPTPASPSAAATSAPGSSAAGALQCRSDAPVTREIRMAMSRFFAGIRVRDPGAYLCTRGSGLSARTVYEAVTGSVAGVGIDVETALRTPDAVAAAHSPRLGSAGGRLVLLARVEAISAGLHVAVDAYGRAGTRPPVKAMRELCDFVSLNVVL